MTIDIGTQYRVTIPAGFGMAQTILLEVMPPRINLLSGHLMALRHLRHRGPVDPDRRDNPQLVPIAPKPPPLDPKNFATHQGPRMGRVVNAVVKHVS